MQFLVRPVFLTTIHIISIQWKDVFRYHIIRHIFVSSCYFQTAVLVINDATEEKKMLSPFL